MGRRVGKSVPWMLALALGILAPIPAWAHGQAGYRDGVLEVVLNQWSLGFETIEVPAGELTLHVVNGGTLQHNLRVEFERGGQEYEFGTPLLAPGEAHVLMAALPPGEYELYCAVPGHKEAGMMAFLRVVPR
ncbi:hypothetical protein [Limnochorda pilosa]|uniref:EfeO-type cupredoxin-like domain-containing protein n=1 Tax=Limnochorda pilosa TaxID=1555112 RepID=A0A0K2SH07_LIMPI|nr:hypothetical protein [Limnochorda pilosa]BAS26398.1 hypothetical protein LIP_0541 [Limnochorda pilosa]